MFPGAVGDQGLIEHWDGSAWSIVPSTTEPLPSGGYLSGLEVRRRRSDQGPSRRNDRHRAGNAAGILVEHWDGTASWRARLGLQCQAWRRRACWRGSPV